MSFLDSLHVVRLPPSVSKAYLQGWLGFLMYEDSRGGLISLKDQQVAQPSNTDNPLFALLCE